MSDVGSCPAPPLADPAGPVQPAEDVPQPAGRNAPDDPVEVLRRWAGSGAIWRVAGRSGSVLEMVLLTCTGEEEMARWTSSDPRLLAFVGDRSGSEDGPD